MVIVFFRGFWKIEILKANFSNSNLLGLIGLAVLTFIRYKQTENRQTDEQSIFIAVYFM